MTPVERAARIAVWTMAGFAVLFLLAPLVVTLMVSFSSSPVFTLPAPEWSLRWYQRIPKLDSFWSALGLSVQVAAFSTAVSLVLGTLAAIAIERGSFRGGERREFVFGDHASLTQKRLVDPFDVGVESADDLDVEEVAEEAVGERPARIHPNSPPCHIVLHNPCRRLS